MLSQLKTGLVHLLYPRLCEGCCRPLLAAEDVLCLGCAQQLPETGYHDKPDNDTVLRLAGRFPFVHATSYAYLATDGLLEHLVHGLKYRNRKSTGYMLGERLGACLAESRWTPVDRIVPVPLHPAKQAERGYNQGMLIAEGISRTWGVPVSGNVLTRLRNTQSQTQKSRTERQENMKDAFGLGQENIAGEHILLVDDVLTTGATVEACACVLLAAGNVKISVATIGIAGS